MENNSQIELNSKAKPSVCFPFVNVQAIITVHMYYVLFNYFSAINTTLF
uniref:GH20113p n=1 Tax=Drosophila melanogaster TaxID=7227 RepID=Q8MSH7_DROME|nr:GH20113p [Drosophila melanogaster]